MTSSEENTASQAISTAQFRVVRASRFGGVWSAQEYISNQFCGDWHEIGFGCEIASANAIVRAAL